MAGQDDQALVGFIVQRHITKVGYPGVPIGNPLWSVERHYEGKGRRTTLEDRNMETGDAILRLRELIEEMQQ